MNGWLLAGAILSFVGFVGHILHGERTYLRAIDRSGLLVEKDVAFTAATLRGAWHVWAFAYALCAALLGIFAFLGLDDGARITLWAIAAMFGAAFVMLLIVTKGRLPAVVLQALIAACTVLGLVL